MTAPDLVHHPIVQVPSSAMLEVAGLVRSSAVDGPGNRFVLFLQGCNFDCLACHNPTTIGRCNACGVCVDACPHGALELPTEGHVTFDASICDRCRACVPLCPIDADATIRLASIDEVIEEIRSVAQFISGITVTGGEPTLQLDGLASLCRRLKSDPGLNRLTILLDTNGTLDEAGWEQLAPVIDGAMVDLKAHTPELHHRLTGHDNDAVRASIRWLAEHDLLAEVRLLVIPGETDDEAELGRWAEFVRSVDPAVGVRVMAFRHLGTRPAARAWPETPPSTVEHVSATLRSMGLTDVYS